MLIGLTGRNAAGKGEVAKYLQTKSFYYYSLSDAIRDELRARKLEVSRESLIQVGNELRQRFGPSVLADRIVELTRARPKLRHRFHPKSCGSRDASQSRKDFKLIRVDAPLQTRFERTVARRRENDPITFEAFVALDNREASGDATSQNLIEVEKLADEVLVNDASLEELRPKIDVLVRRLLTDRADARAGINTSWISRASSRRDPIA